MTDSKIHIKIGALEISFEGSEGFIKDNLLTMVKDIKDLFNIKETSFNPPPATSAQQLATEGEKQFCGTVTTIAAKLGVKNGPELIMASAAYLVIGEGCGDFTRKQIIDTMKTASGYYKESYLSNLTTSLNGLIKKGRINEVAKDTYSLPRSEKTELGKRLAT